MFAVDAHGKLSGSTSMVGVAELRTMLAFETWRVPFTSSTLLCRP